MSQELFPSGPWTGFYNYSPKDKHRMDLELTFSGGRVHGVGVDDVGRFRVEGQYDVQTLECSWVKTYFGAHSVFYRGFREGKGIWGRWEITAWEHGGFHIWPKAEGEGDAQTEAAERLEPAVAAAAQAEVGRSAATYRIWPAAARAEAKSGHAPATESSAGQRAKF